MEMINHIHICLCEPMKHAILKALKYLCPVMQNPAVASLTDFCVSDGCYYMKKFNNFGTENLGFVT